MNEIKREQIINELIYLANLHDKEAAHIRADGILTDILIALGYEDIVDAYEEIDKWYA